MTSTAFASRRSVEIFGSRFPASIRLTSVTWTPLRCATSSWVSPRRSRASRSLVPKWVTAGIVCAGDTNRHRKLHKSLRRLLPSMPPRDEDGGAGHEPYASGPRPAPYIARLSRASSLARWDRRSLLARSALHSPPFLVFQRVVPLDKEGMLRKYRVSAKKRPGQGVFSRQALMLWHA